MQRGFEQISQKQWDNDFHNILETHQVDYPKHQLPKRGSKNSAGYDFFSPINEIIPELRKTLAKVCSKIYSHILNTFLMLNKPGTNIQIIQKNVFLKMKQLVIFLKKHAPSMYTELLNKYVYQYQ